WPTAPKCCRPTCSCPVTATGSTSTSEANGTPGPSTDLGRNHVRGWAGSPPPHCLSWLFSDGLPILLAVVGDGLLRLLDRVPFLDARTDDGAEPARPAFRDPRQKLGEQKRGQRGRVPCP